MRVTTKGQVTIPKPVRRQLGIEPGSEVAFETGDGRVYLVKRTKGKTRNRFARARGAATARMSTDEILALTRKA